MTRRDAKIGIVGGAGPYAGLDLAQKLLFLRLTCIMIKNNTQCKTQYRRNNRIFD